MRSVRDDVRPFKVARTIVDGGETSLGKPKKKEAVKRETDRLQASTSHRFGDTRDRTVRRVRSGFDKNRNDRVQYGEKKRMRENRGLAAGAAPDRGS